MRNLGKTLIVGICSFSIFLFCATSAFSEGSIDASFGENGLVATDFGLGDDEAFDIVVQKDGRIVTVGFSYNGAVRNFAVSRYLQDGRPDPDFGSNGVATFSLGSGDSTGRAVAVQEDGKIVIAGSTGSIEQDIALLRLTDDGNLDDSFGSNGQVVLTDAGGDAFAETVGIGADGSVVLAGSSKSEGEPVAAIIVKFDSDGELDTSFGESGVSTFRRPYNTSSHGLVILEDGEILVAGSSSSNGGYGGIVFRLDRNGNLDSSFGMDGEAELAITDRDAELFDLLVLENGSLVATGYMHNGSYREPILARFSAGGEVDQQFGTEGIVQSNLGNDGIAYDVAVKEDGSYLMTGYENTPAGRNMILIEVDGPGTIAASPEETMEIQPALSEDESGAVPNEVQQTSAPRYLVTDLGSDNDVSRAIAVTSEGLVLTAGHTSNGTDTDMVVVRYTAETLPQGTRAIGDSDEGIVTGKFFMLTLPVFNITRNSAASGGRIVARVSEQDCDQYCEILCEESSDADCETTCLEECIPQEVIERGIVFGVVPFPSYSATEDTDDTGDDTGTGDEAASQLFPENGFDTSFNYHTVRSGQTSDGSGVGDFGSDIVDITPDVLYYVRAFAVLDDETVIYGNQVSFRTSDSCFIATAAYGSILDEHVVVLRQFRDQILQKYVWGKQLIAVYYDYSPQIADLIRQSELLRGITRVALMPIVGLSYVTLHGGPIAMVIVLLLMVAFSMLAFLLVKRIRGEKQGYEL